MVDWYHNAVLIAVTKSSSEGVLRHVCMWRVCNVCIWLVCVCNVCAFVYVCACMCDMGVTRVLYLVWQHAVQVCGCGAGAVP